ncbi:insulysin [Wickerhamomyces ciferrii]|uniref:Insulysin n=1 Tax=Wickerhamomyces ciferrii (strain ATCC 14091 / BCRC 22168 / CBS 111 / JCM 3599 / NBRC 0793 / NRRL Y-1031 F-60-10) TaxID=1206466 RepID=K0KLK0_WICCF|nr:insulysin [Wickerhamomyces ciferrii]CCH46140.1 insulysin [Wickerhamomyces ciferrii]
MKIFPIAQSLLRISFNRFTHLPFQASFPTSTQNAFDPIATRLPFRTMATFQTSNKIEKPDLDDRDYKILNLENGLTALLISDSKTDKSAAALDVNVGSFSDYEHLPGLAHFCEHLLFMGTKKYPSENEYSSYLSNHGGHSNAYTAAEDTNYYFEVNHQYLEGALDRFSQFFISPLFDASCKDREIRAVDSENKKNLQSDLWRLYQLEKSLSNPVHPFHKFSTGNLETLEEIPKSQGIDVREELLKFYKDSYSANLMKLAIIGREDLETLEKWVIEKFKDVPNFGVSKPQFESAPYTQNEAKKLIKAKPVMSKNKLALSFIAPDHQKHWEVHTGHYFSHLIGHEGNGSLLAFLKTKSWANGLSAGGYSVSEGCGQFSIDIDLTEEGLKYYEDVLYATFQYLELLRVSLPQKWIYDELKDVSEMNFRFKQKSSPSGTVSKLAKDLQKTFIPDENVISRSVLRSYNPDLISEYGNALNVDNVRVTLISQNVKTDKQEKWYGTEYSVEDLSEELISKLRKPALNGDLHLPNPNDFIPTNFEVEKLEDVEPLKKPALLKSDDKIRAWYKKDDQFWVPKGYIQLLINLPITVATPVNNVLTNLFVDLLDDALIDTSYQAELAGLSFSLHQGKEGLVLEVAGYNEKAPVLLREVLKKLVSFKATEDRFNVFKEKYTRNLKNYGYKVPYSQISSVFANILNENTWEVEEKLSVLENITFEDLSNFTPLIFKQTFVETLIEGNFQPKEAHEIISVIEDNIKAEPLTKTQKVKSRSFWIPDNKAYRYEKDLPDEKNKNTCVQHFIQVGELKDRPLQCITELLAQLIKEPAFDTLRTKEQLGYIVFSGLLESRTTFGIRVIVQSERNSTYLESRIDNFFKQYHTTLKELSEEEFEKNKEALINRKLETLKNLGHENNRFLRAISNGFYDFLHNETETEILKKITKAEMLEFYENKILQNHSKLIINLHSKANEDHETVEGYPTGEVIEDVGELRSLFYLTPSAKPVEELTIENFKPKL